MRLILKKWKSIVLPVLLLANSSVFSQRRMVDQEVICISPEGSVINGAGLPLEFEMMNHGPDPRYKNDSLLYWLYVVEANGDSRLTYQGSLAGKEEGIVEPGDTRRYAGGYGIRFDYPPSDQPIHIDYCVAISTFSVDDNGDTIQYFSHYDPNLENNVCCKPVTIMPRSASVATALKQQEEGIWVYPNPAKDVLFIDAPAWTVEAPDITMGDISGRLLIARSFAEKDAVNGRWRLDVTRLPAGIYYMQIHTLEGVASRKIVIEH